MKICFINNLYKPYHRGGAETFVDIVRQGAREAGHECFVISTRPFWFSKKNEEEKNGHYLDSWYFSLDKIPKPFRLLWHFANYFCFYKYNRIKKILQKEKPDLIVTNNILGLGWLIFILIKRIGIKHVHILHDIQLLHPSGLLFYGGEKLLTSSLAKLYIRINIFLTKDIQFVISPSKWLLSLHLQNGFFSKSRTKVMPNPADKIFLQQQLKSRSDNIFKILSIGHINQAKGFLVIKKAAELLSKIGFDKKIELHFAGNIMMGKKFLTAPKGVDFIFHGFVDKQKIKQLLSEADCLVLASLCYENSPSVLYEAASFDLPVICSNIGGIYELAEFFGYTTFEPGNARDLSEKIFQIIKGRSVISFEKRKNNILGLTVEKYLDNFFNFIT